MTSAGGACSLAPGGGRRRKARKRARKRPKKRAKSGERGRARLYTDTLLDAEYNGYGWSNGNEQLVEFVREPNHRRKKTVAKGEEVEAARKAEVAQGVRRVEEVQRWK